MTYRPSTWVACNVRALRSRPATARVSCLKRASSLGAALRHATECGLTPVLRARRRRRRKSVPDERGPRADAGALINFPLSLRRASAVESARRAAEKAGRKECRTRFGAVASVIGITHPHE